jgi:hypothetical protein
MNTENCRQPSAGKLRRRHLARRRSKKVTTFKETGRGDSDQRRRCGGTCSTDTTTILKESPIFIGSDKIVKNLLLKI